VSSATALRFRPPEVDSVELSARRVAQGILTRCNPLGKDANKPSARTENENERIAVPGPPPSAPIPLAATTTALRELKRELGLFLARRWPNSDREEVVLQTLCELWQCLERTGPLSRDDQHRLARCIAGRVAHKEWRRIQVERRERPVIPRWMPITPGARSDDLLVFSEDALGLGRIETVDVSESVSVAMKSALLQLSARQRTVVWLVVVEDLSEAEVAGVLGITRGSITRHKNRGIERLEAILGEGEESVAS
jgi:RNA polymerase sigma factor (sigma-70 family)